MSSHISAGTDRHTPVMKAATPTALPCLAGCQANSVWLAALVLCRFVAQQCLQPPLGMAFTL